MSEKSCENGCITSLRFPRRPGTEITPADGDGCPCCSHLGKVSGDNRPSLSHFNYRIGTYGSIREWLFHQINQTPNLQKWTHREPDDPAIALLEGASILGDILTFYQETYANEAFLRTAKWRESIADLVRLLGYRLSPPVGGNATFAFEIKKDEAVTIPKGFPLKAELQPLAKPADFETREEITAYPWLSKFNLYRPFVSHDITAATTEFYISSPKQLIHPIALKPGDRLMIGESDASALTQPLKMDHAEIVLVDSVREMHGTKIYKIKGKMKRKKKASSLIAYKIGRTFHHFGHNSPYEIVDESKPVTSSSDVSGTTTTTSSTIPKLQVPRYRPVKDTLASKAVDTRFGPLEFPLDTEVNNIPNNVPVIIQAGFIHQKLFPAQWYRPPHITLVRTILDQKSITAKWGGISGTVTQLNLKELLSLSAGSENDDLIKQTEKEFADADAAKSKALADLNAAKNNVKTKITALNAAKKTSANADKDLAEKNAEALSASSNAATLAVAQEMAAAALKDDAIDIAAQTLAGHVETAMYFINGAKSMASTVADKAEMNMDAAETEHTKARNRRNNFQPVISPDPVSTAVTAAASGAADAVLSAVDFSKLKTSAETIKNLAEPVARSLGEAVASGTIIGAAVEALLTVAAADADASQRYEAAKLAASHAQSAAGTAKTTADSAKATAMSTLDKIDAAELELASGNDLVASMSALHLRAVDEAEIRFQAKMVRMYIGDPLFHEVLSPLFRLKHAKTETTDASGVSLNFYGTADQVKDLKDRRIMLDYPETEAEINTVTTVPTLFDLETQAYPQLYPITLSTSIKYADYPNENPTVIAYGNLAEADEGKTQPEVPIGSGNATQVFQNFKLPKAPLTYHIVPENTPSETPEAEIYVDGRKWEKVESFFGRGRDEQIYIIRESADGSSWVQFGDGKSGARLPNGINNVTAVYRIGDGAYGELKPDTKVQASAKLKNLDKVQMPLPATGGAPTEDGDNAANAAPGKVQSLGRIVSLADFEAEAAAIAGVARTSARWQLRDNVPTIVVTVLMETGRAFEISTVADTLRSYNTLRGAGRDPVSTDEGRRMYVTASVKYALKTGYRADLVEPEIRLVLGVNYAKTEGEENQTGLFSMRQRKFGAAEYSATIEGVVQNVDGVLWAETVTFQQITDSDDPVAIELPTVSSCETTVACDSDHILSLYDKHLFLAAVVEGAS